MRSSVLMRWYVLLLAEEEDRRRDLYRSQRARVLLRQEVNVFKNLTEAQFIKSFGLRKSAVRQLTEDVLPHLRKSRRSNGITRTSKVLIALAYYASGSYQALLGQRTFHNVSQPTVSRAVREVTEVLNNPLIFRKYVHWPLKKEINEMKAKFDEFRIPGVIGCIGGTHVAILNPHINEEHYLNRNGYHSLNVMIICDSDLNITCVDASGPGSVHESSIWQSHPLCQLLSEVSNSGEHVFILGDSGFPLTKTVMTPILHAVEGTAEHHYNELHVSAHNLVECCIGVLKARFRCLLAARTLRYDPMTAGKIVNACCVLHNIANKTSAPLSPLSPEELEQENRRQNHTEHQELLEAESGTEVLEGQALRQKLVEELWRERV